MNANGKSVAFQIEKVEGGTGDLELLPCPFCGNKEIVYMMYNSECGPRWKVTCGNCDAEIDPGYAQQKANVQILWNRRAQKKDKNCEFCRYENVPEGGNPCKNCKNSYMSKFEPK